ncbi:helix-turn-helix domain-containing protein [Yoonia vestfoldensis]|uniref:Helix-turn-helix domain protein n=1 Tax=Yoonia vestfoldensis TaxID=245188 RepID=A0A1Y0EGH8_9RHOB|nr:helix-turn-helix domain-containing protein [Yoonia vestfoldensis]ARU02471.1 helix-turn-helix domain protein [Yoonia vestfoldensis]
MSHAATNWAIQRRGLKPTTKIVLWHLCDRFNPDYGCFPSQARLAHDCEISRSTLNDHLGQLEAAGLLRRVPRIHPVTKRQMPTRYILGFEPGFTPHDTKPCPETGHGALPFDGTVSGDQDSCAELADPQDPCPKTGHGIGARPVSDFAPDPCPENGQSRVRNPDTNLVREPLREPVKEEEDARGRETGFDDFFGDLLKALGFNADSALPAWWQGSPARQHAQRWIDDLGMSQERILAVARETREAHPAPPDGPKALDRAMERAVRREAQPAANSLKAKSGSISKRQPQPSPDETAAFYAAKVNSNEYLPQNMISTATCGLMLERGLVTLERLQLRGVL